MFVIDNLSRQHREILDLTAQISAQLQKKSPVIKDIGALLPQFAGKLKRLS